MMKQSILADFQTEAAERITYSQNWPAYNEAQANEKLAFLDVLSDLCSFIPMEENGRVGRPKANLQEMVYSCVAKVYERSASRCMSSDLKIAKRMGYMEHVPHFNTVLKYMDSPELTPILLDLIQMSALPLRDIENTFAVDASGLSTGIYSRWLDHKYKMDVRFRDWKKVHIICGTKTNIVTNIVVTGGRGADCKQFPVLVEGTARFFKMQEISADKAYSTRNNLQTASNVGAIPFIPFRKNTTGKSQGCTVWSRMFYYSLYYPDDFNRYYHKRSNVEATFSMLKRKLDGRLLMKKEVGQVNEALAKVLCHNIRVLIQEFYELGINLGFQDFAHLFPRLHINSEKPVN